MNKRGRTYCLLLFVLLPCFHVSAQTAKERALTIAKAFSGPDSKHKDTVSPDIQADIGRYAGKYIIDGMYQYLAFSRQGNEWQLVFSDPKHKQLAVVSGIRVEYGLLTGKLVHDTDGRTENFEAVFLQGSESKGIGFVQLLKLGNGFVADKAYYRKR